MLAELQMEEQVPVAKQGAADARAQRHDALEAVALTTPRPCTAASLSMRTGVAKRAARASINAEPGPVLGAEVGSGDASSRP